MALRWYSTVVDCADVAALSRWWAEALGWQVVYEADDEVVIVPAHVTEESIRSTPWAEVGPGIVFVPVPEGKTVKNRIHIDLAPHTSDDRDAEIDRLVGMGATADRRRAGRRRHVGRARRPRGQRVLRPVVAGDLTGPGPGPTGQRSSGAISRRSALSASAAAMAAARSTTAVK